DVAWGASVDVPVKVTSDRQGEVILTNLQLGLQFNQPTGQRAGGINTGADRPLDWTTIVTGSHSQGETVTFSHTLTPDVAPIQPCKVYDQSGSTLMGVGRYCADFGSGSVAAGFGTGRDGNLLVDSGQITSVDNTRTPIRVSTTAGQNFL